VAVINLGGLLPDRSLRPTRSS